MQLPLRSPPAVVPFHPRYLSRSAFVNSVWLDCLYEPNITKDASAIPKVSAVRNRMSRVLGGFDATQATAANQPEWIAGEGIRFTGTGSARQFFNIPNVQYLSDYYALAYSIKLAWAANVSANPATIWNINGTASSDTNRWLRSFYRGSDKRWSCEFRANGLPNQVNDTVDLADGWHTVVQFVGRDGDTYISLDGRPPVPGADANVIPKRNTGGAAVTGVFGLDANVAAQFTIRDLLMLPDRMTEDDCYKAASWLAGRTNPVTALVPSAPYPAGEATTEMAAVRAVRNRSRSYRVRNDQIENVAAYPWDESGNYVNQLDLTGFIQTFNEDFEGTVAEKVTDEAIGNGPFYAPCLPNTTGPAPTIWQPPTNAAYFSKPEASVIRLSARRTASGSANFNGATMQSRNLDGSRGFSQRQGVFAVRARLNVYPTATTHPEFRFAPLWPYSDERMSDRAVTYGEIDQPEIYVRSANQWHGAMHVHGPTHTAQPGVQNYDSTQSNIIGASIANPAKWNIPTLMDGQFHEYAVCIDPDQERVIYYLDGRELCRKFAPPAILNMSWFIVSWLEAYAQGSDTTIVTACTMDIDWLRIWQKPGWGEPVS